MSINIGKNKRGEPVVYDSDFPDLAATRPVKAGGHFHFRENKPLPHDYDVGLTCRATTKNLKQAQQFLLDLCKDSVRSGQLSLKIRRPSGVSRERFGIATMKAAGEPMLTANPRSISSGLNQQTVKQAKARTVHTMVVKPNCLEAAKAGRNSSFWGERAWKVSQLKYSSGYVITTDTGQDSSPFTSLGKLYKAIKESGWDIIENRNG